MPRTDIIDLTSDNETESTEVENEVVNRKKNPACIEVKKENTLSNKKLKLENHVFYEDVQVIEKESLTRLKENMITRVSPIPGNRDISDNEVEIFEIVNELQLPHMRQHCTKFKFDVKFDVSNNSKFCDLCYCFVCDCTASDCQNWCNSDKSSPLLNSSGPYHCNANDKDKIWTQRRHQKKNPNFAYRNNYDDDSDDNVSGPDSFFFGFQQSDSDGMGGSCNSGCSGNDFYGYGGYSHYRGYVKSIDPNLLPGDGPWETDHANASEDTTLTTCQKCGWYSRLKKSDDTFHSYWCHKCGRVCDASTFTMTKQSAEYCRKDGDILLGEKIIPFRMVARNILGMEAFRDSWIAADTTNEAWKYRQEDIEQETFQQRLGKKPTLGSILKTVSIVEQDKLPQDGTFRKENSSRNNADEVEAIFLDSYKHLLLIRSLYDLEIWAPKFQLKNPYAVDITATWDKQTRTGNFTIRVFLTKHVFTNFINHNAMFLFLGAWFDILPLNLIDLTGHHEAIEDNELNIYCSTPIPPFSSGDVSIPAIKSKMTSRIKGHNRDVKNACKKSTLSSSSGKGSIGGFTDNDISLKGTLLRFYRNMIFTNNCFINKKCNLERWIAIELEITSGHRSMNTHNKYLNPLRENTIEALVKHNDGALACNIIKSSSKVINEHCKSINGVFDHLENLGHEAVVHVTGLNIELLEFQKQSLMWAIERENIPGGIQSYFWAKIPVIQELNTELYYNPITCCFRKDKPRVVRGGFIAEEMGLGKTIISLALMLENPAPELPKSCSPVSSLSTLITQCQEQEEIIGWDKNLYQQTSEKYPKRGSIISRGTLVVCPVSLVGQWIEEAKSKLVNPGLIYSYHGSKRNRDPRVLANNTIVVTTYKVLVSDDNYYRHKPDEADYCPPLEEIRWWRIICDEGHFLRQSNTQRYRAISNIVADHKWLVSGTPVNTSFNDLKSQLKFLGIENVDQMFTYLNYQHNRVRGSNHFEPGLVCFLLRSIMIRHTLKQKYRGTNSSLMTLPLKRELSIEVTLSNDERKEYDLLDQKAKSFYFKFKEKYASKLSSHYLLLSQKLTPMRIACSGGSYLLQEEENDTAEEKPKVTQYSSFAFTSKFKVLLLKLEKIRDEDPSSKSLVFSQYTSTLDWLKNELPKHGFEYRTLSGNMPMEKRAKALHDFQCYPQTTIFLLTMRAGNCGINLTQANRVFLMEPCFNPALEKQAIGRVHRLGQKREVEIIRLIIKDSVETRIGELLQKKYGANSICRTIEDGQNEGKNELAEQEIDKIGPVGNLVFERTSILSDEFDILFGSEEIVNQEDAQNLV